MPGLLARAHCHSPLVSYTDVKKARPPVGRAPG